MQVKCINCSAWSGHQSNNAMLHCDSFLYMPRHDVYALPYNHPTGLVANNEFVHVREAHASVTILLFRQNHKRWQTPKNSQVFRPAAIIASAASSAEFPVSFNCHHPLPTPFYFYRSNKATIIPSPLYTKKTLYKGDSYVCIALNNPRRRYDRHVRSTTKAI